MPPHRARRAKFASTLPVFGYCNAGIAFAGFRNSVKLTIQPVSEILFVRMKTARACAANQGVRAAGTERTFAGSVAPPILSAFASKKGTQGDSPIASRFVSGWRRSIA